MFTKFEDFQKTQINEEVNLAKMDYIGKVIQRLLNIKINTKDESCFSYDTKLLNIISDEDYNLQSINDFDDNIVFIYKYTKLEKYAIAVIQKVVDGSILKHNNVFYPTFLKYLKSPTRLFTLETNQVVFCDYNL